MKVILTAIEDSLADAWEGFCSDVESVTIYRGSILQVSCDAVVSPANSFGFMEGGVDLLFSQHFGHKVQERLQQLIIDKHCGELLIGAAEIVETDDSRIPYLIAAPTMRVPMSLENSVNPYLAARAALLLVKHGTFVSGKLEGEPISRVVKTIAFPGLGTGVGRVEPNVCAYQVRAAIEEVLLGQYTFPQTWMKAQERHQQLYTHAP